MPSFLTGDGFGFRQKLLTAFDGHDLLQRDDVEEASNLRCFQGA